MKKRLYVSKLITLALILSGWHWSALAQCNCAWQYTLPITVTNLGATAQTNYQVPITINTAALISAGKMLASGNDIRFTDNSGSCNNVQYWIESGINTTTTKIWIKVPSIPASGSTTINMYYGNASASAASNGDSTFVFFDNFPGSTLNASKWTTVIGSGSAVVGGNQISLSTSGCSWAQIDAINAFPAPFYSEMNVVSASGNWPAIVQADNSAYSNNVYMNMGNGTILYAGNSSSSPWGSSLTTITGSFTSPAGIWSIVRTPSNTQMAYPGSGTYTYTGGGATSGLSTQNTAFGTLNCGTATLVISWFRVRKYYASGTTQTVGSEAVNGAAAITGPNNVCVGGNITLSDVSPGGSWSTGSTNVSVTPTGVVTGISAGTASITYATGACTPSTYTVTVNPLPGSITGVLSVCSASSTTLSSSSSGGTWSSSNSSQASVGSSSGIVVGGTPSTSPTITYTLPTGCLTTAVVTVNPFPAAISGSGTVCGSQTTTLTDATTGGTWSSASTSIASVGLTTGVVTGGSAGTVTISYISPVGCLATFPITVKALSAIAGVPSTCLGLTTTLTDATAGGTWSSSNTAVATITSSGFVTTLTTGSTTISYFVSSSGCTATLTFNVTPSPSTYAMTGGGSYCSGGTGVAVGLSGSDAGVAYQLYNGLVPVGPFVVGSGIPVTFGLQTAGSYNVKANPGTACSTNMSGSVTVTANPLPTAFAVTGGGNYCVGGTGVNVQLSGSTIGVNYQLFVGVTPVGTPVAGTGAILNFGLQTAVGSYTVVATNISTGCVNTMAGSATVATNPLPVPQTVTGGGGYCVGGRGSAIGLLNSVSGTNYQLVLSGVLTGPVVAGTGGPISFGLITTGGSYTVLATNTSTGCQTTMSGSATVTVNPLPTPFSVTGGGSYCLGSATGVNIGLNGSTLNVNYQLFYTPLVGATVPVGGPVPGTGFSLTFSGPALGGTYTNTGSYSVVATNTITGCQNNMTGSVAVSTNALPSLFTATGGGGYCSGGTGVPVGLSGSVVGTTYQLLLSGGLVGALSGTGSPLAFGPITTPGVYTIVATVTGTGCTQNMLGSSTVTINPLPLPQTITIGSPASTTASICAGTLVGQPINLTGSQSGVNYQLFNGPTPVGSVVAGTGALLLMGNVTSPGSYSVVATNATTGCTNNMTGSVSLTINPVPNVYTVTGGGGYCAGPSGVHIGLSASNAGVNYALKLGSTTITTVPGIGAAIDFGAITAVGTYTVTATDAVTSCTSNMSGSAIVSINPLPNATFVLSPVGSSSYCAGGTGVVMTLSNTELGVNYQLKNSGVPAGPAIAGTGALINFPAQTATGTYTVVATNGTTGCTSNETGSVTVSINALPLPQVVTGGGAYCSGGTGVVVSLASTQSGVSYQLMNGAATVGAPVLGAGSGISFAPATGAGTYTVKATNAAGCTATMSGTAIITVNPLPATFTITEPSGSNYCAGGAGVPIGLSGSNVGTNYQLMLASAPVGAPVAGSGVGISFGMQTTPGSYTVIATNATTGCQSTMTGTAPVVANTLPASHTITSVGTNYCPGGPGVVIGLDGSNSGTNYQLFVGSTPVGFPLPGINAPLSFGPQPATGVYTVVANNGCVATMAGSITVGLYTLPTVYSVTGGGNYCPGGAGVTVGLNGSHLGVNYQLYNTAGPVGFPVAGTGFAISFGLQTAAGNYTVVAMDATSSCTSNMLGSVNVIINSLPNLYTVTGGGNYCSGSAGVPVGLDGSDIGTNYQLYIGGSAPVGSALHGTGLPLNFGIKTAAGSYTIIATSTSTGCSTIMVGGAVITPVTPPNAYAVTGGGNYCAGGAGVAVGLFLSDIGVNYQLYNGSTPVGIPMAGTSAALSFGTPTAAGTYTIVGTDTLSGCSSNMTGNAVIGINPLPVAYTVTGGGNYCAGGTGVHVMLSSSNTGINYQLLVNGVATGGIVAGTGSMIDFGPQTLAGVYTVQATNPATTCTNTMAASVSVGVNSLPNIYTVVGTGTNYCSGGAGIDITMSGSDAGVNYQLYIGSITTGVPFTGSGFVMDFGYQTASGFYTAVAINPATGCSSTMSGGATVSINPLPNAYTVTGGGSYCDGGTGVAVGLSNSTVGVSYRLKDGVGFVGSPVLGTGFALTFGLQTAPGNYTVVATNISTSCTNTMSGSVLVSINPLPTAYSVTGGGNYCAGGAGSPVGLSGSTSGVNYQLYNGITPVGGPMAGNGLAISFGPQTAAGVYTVMAIDAVTGCAKEMTGSVTVGINSLPSSYSVTGGGNYCPGGSGVNVGLGGSNSGISYQLYNGVSPVGLPSDGTGLSFGFGLQTAAGTYSVVATNSSTGCSATMAGTVTVGLNSLPNVYSVIGGGSYCEGGSGVHVGLNSSSAGVNYQLMNGGPVGAPVAGVAGSPLDFGFETAAGVYTVVATDGTTGCTSNMSGSATIVVNPHVTPAVTLSTGVGDTVCAGHLVSFSALTTNGGTLATYDWSVNGYPQSAVGSNFNYMPINGDVIAVVLHSSAACATPPAVSTSLTITVLDNGMPAVTVTSTPGDTVCHGTAVNFTATDVFGGTPDLTWVVNGANVSTGSSYSYVPVDNDIVYVSMNSNYRCRSVTTVQSNHIMMSVQNPVIPTIAITANPGNNIGKGQEVTFTASVTNGGPAPSYQWFVNGVQISGANQPVYTSSNLNNKDSVTCQVVSDGPCAGLLGFNSVIVHVTSVGVQQISTGGGDIQLIPNPNKGTFIVKGTLGTTADEEVSLEVTDMLGQVIYNGKVMTQGGNINERIQLNGNIANGMYLLNLRSESNNKVFHIVVEQ